MKLRKKKDKRVLKSPRSANTRNNKRIRRRNSNRPPQNNQRFGRNSNPRNNERIRMRNAPNVPRKQKKASKTTLIIMVIALIAFVVGAGAGISLALGGGDEHAPQFENVTVEMTSNLSDVDEVYFDSNDSIDFNDASYIRQNNLTNYSLSY